MTDFHAVVGARAHRNLAAIWRFVRDGLPPGVGVVSGAADGPDTVAAIAGRQAGREVLEIQVPTWPDQTREEFRREALKRNGEVVDVAKKVEAFPWGPSNGTRHTMGLARKTGKLVHEHDPSPPYPSAGPLLVFSAPFGYAGRGRLDITRGSGKGTLAFAPSQVILDRALAAREKANALRTEGTILTSRQMSLGESHDEVRARELRAASMLEQAEAIEAGAWARYEPAFIAEMRISYGLKPGGPRWGDLEQEAWNRGVRPQQAAWKALFDRAWLCLVCYCPSDDRCHRHLLRSRILPALGAVDGVEIRVRETA